MPTLETYEIYNIPAAGATKSFDVIDPVTNYEINATGGAVVLLADMNFTTTGTPLIGMIFKFIYGGGVTSNTAGGVTVNFFGTALTDAQALIELKIEAYYNGTTWQVMIFADDQTGLKAINGADIVNLSIPTGALANKAITLGKTADLVARGYLTRGGVAGVVEGFNAVTSGQIVMGNGNDVISQAVTGDVTINGSGVTAIGAAKVTAAMLNFTVATYLEATLTIPVASVLTLNGTPITIVAAPGSGKYIEVVSASASMTFVSAVYATNTTLQLIQEGSQTAQMENTGMLISSITKNTRFIDSAAAAAGNTQITTNAALQVKVATGNPTLGDSIVKIHCVYRIVQI